MISRRTFFKLAAAAGSTIAGLSGFAKAVMAGLSQLDRVVWIGELAIPGPLDKFVNEILKHPAITNVTTSRYVEFNSNSVGIKAIGWSEEHQRHFYCGTYMSDEDLVLGCEAGFDAMLKMFFDSIDWTLKLGPPKT